MRLVDTHCHLESEEFGDTIEDVVRDAEAAGVVRMLTCAITPDQWPQSAALARRFASVDYALGVHPWYAREEDLGRMAALAEAAALGARAIGEIGLDSKVASPSFELQTRIFEAQLGLARELGLPVSMHCRGAFGEMLRSLKRVGAPFAGAIHAFAGSVELAEEFMRYNLSFSMGRSLTYRNSRKRQAVLKRVYPDRFLLETDSPDMPPVEAPQDRPNVPANIRYVLRAAAEILGAPEEEVAERTTANATRVFGWEV